MFHSISAQECFSERLAFAKNRDATSTASSSHGSWTTATVTRDRTRSRGASRVSLVSTEVTPVLRDRDRFLSLSLSLEENERGVCPREPPESSFSPSRNVILPLAHHVPSSSSLASVVQESLLRPSIDRPTIRSFGYFRHVLPPQFI